MSDDDPAEVLVPPTGERPFRTQRRSPMPGLAGVVGHLWAVQWSVPDGDEHVQEVLSHPCIHLTLEPDGAWVNGVVTHRFSRRLIGSGRVVGVHFRPAGFAAISDVDATSLTNQVISAGDVLDIAGLPTVTGPEPVDEILDQLASWLLAREPVTPTDAVVVDQAVDLATEDRGLTRVEQLAERVGVTPRTLQRRFSRYLGVHPKWVIQRARIHDALERMDNEDVDWATLAVEVGFADQPHFVNAFTALAGVPPTAYQARPSVRAEYR